MASINPINNIIPAANLTISAGNLLLPTTSSSVGQIQINASRVFHTYGTNNTFAGSGSGNFTLSGLDNTGFGTEVMVSLTGGNYNTAIGYHSLNAVAGGSDNVAVGNQSLLRVTSGTQNIAIGNDNLGVITTQSYNCAIGHNSQTACSTGQRNNSLGNQALKNNTSGNNNCAFGDSTLINNTGDRNTAYGNNSFQTLTGGSYNLGIGYLSGNNYTGSESSNLLINNAGLLGESNVIRLGSTGSGAQQQNKCFIAGVDGVNVGSVAKVLTMASEQCGTATITAGTGVSIATSANTITVNVVGSGLTWTVISANQTAAVNNGYFANKAGTLALALPATSAVGDTISVTNENTATGTQFTQAAGQQILIGNTNTTLGATGTLTSVAIGDTLTLVCKTANTIWRVVSMVGNWTPV